MKIKIVDDSLVHIKENKYDLVEFDRSPINNNDELVVFTDHKLQTVDSYQDYDCIKVAWLIEPMAIIQSYYGWVASNYDKFDYVLTHHKCMLDSIPNAIEITFGGCWIDLKDHAMYSKSKLVSIIASGKNFTEGHRLRHNCIAQNKDFMDVYGLQYNYIENKIDGLKDYAFQVVIENVREDYFFTEKLIDCFATGTVPIYWGCPSIGEYFDTRGMIICNDLNEINHAIQRAKMIYYDMKIDGVKENLKWAKKHLEYEGLYNGIKKIKEKHELRM